MHINFARTGVAVLIPVLAAALLTSGSPSAAPVGISLANNYGTVAIVPLASTSNRFTYRFTVTNLTSTSNPPYFGIEGLAVYSPIAPLTASDPPNTTVTHYTAKRGFTEWTIRPGNVGDPNKDKIPDRFIEPGETVPNAAKNLDFDLTFSRAIDPSEFDFALHLYTPRTGRMFYAHPNPAFCGQVACTDGVMKGQALVGAKVELVNANTFQVVATTTTDSNGNYVITTDKAGDYFVRVSAADFNTVSTTNTSFTLACPDVCQNVTLPAAAVNFLASNDVSGLVYFSDSSNFQIAADPNRTLTAADLSNPAFTFNATNHTFRFQGTIPNFPELGSFGGPGQTPLWVLVMQPTLPEDHYVNHSFVNIVLVQDGIGTTTPHNHVPFTARFLALIPFVGPGTAHSLKTTGLRVTFSSPNVQVDAAPTWTDLPAATTDGSVSTSGTPSAGEVPPGFMARTRFSVRIPSGVQWSAFDTVNFANVCGTGTTAVTVDPDVPPSP